MLVRPQGNERHRDEVLGPGAVAKGPLAEEVRRPIDRGLAGILASVGDALLVIDRAWNIAYANNRAASLDGRLPQDIIGRNLWATFPQWLGISIEAHFRRAMAEQVIASFEVQEPISG